MNISRGVYLYLNRRDFGSAKYDADNLSTDKLDKMIGYALRYWPNTYGDLATGP